MTQDEPSLLCPRGCHVQSGVLHFRACCEGKCPGCGLWFKTGLKPHTDSCGPVAPTAPLAAPPPAPEPYPPRETKVIQCNYREDTSAVTARSRVYVRRFEWPRVFILARSRSGRWIEQWVAVEKLHNFRLKTLVPDDPLYERLGGRYGGHESWTQEGIDKLNAPPGA